MSTAFMGVRVPETLHARLKEVADDQGRSVSNLVVRVLRAAIQELDEHEGKQPSEYKE